ncbi:MAG: P-loop NTPase [Acidobacteriota bacterium]
MSVTPEEVQKALERVLYPGFSRNIVSFGIVKDVQIESGTVILSITPTTDRADIIAQIEEGIRREVATLPGVSKVQVKLKKPEPVLQQQPKGIPDKKPIPGVKKLIAVASGKGGVGKSTVAVNLALALARLNVAVGLMDSDIYGPSIPLMMGVTGKPLSSGGKILPMENYGVRMTSLGFFMAPGEAAIWRGPMVMKAVQQLLYDVEWGELDYLIVDLPPGTGDAQLTLAQIVPVDGAIIVSTPQEVALIDAVKGVNMFKTMNVPILGIIENMSYFVCPHCGERTEIFSHGGARRKAAELGVPYLGEIPIDPAIRAGGDEGNPAVNQSESSPQSQAFFAVARMVLEQVKLTTQ